MPQKASVITRLDLILMIPKSHTFLQSEFFYCCTTYGNH